MHKVLNEKPDIPISIKTVAEYFGVSIRTIRSWMEKDENFPKPFKKYSTLRFKRNEIEAYWNENKQDPDELIGNYFT